jgi:hypothetical protein
MRKMQTRRPYVVFGITGILLASILFINNDQILFAENGNNNNITAIGKAAMPTRSPPTATDNGVATMKPTPELSSNPANILDSFMSPKALLASTIDQIRNSTARNDNSNNETSGAIRNVTIFVKNPGTLLLSHQIIPAKDFIPVYDAMPYEIKSGYVSAKLPCDSNSKTSLQILAGQFPELKAVELKLITALSQPGYTCMYYANLGLTNNDTAITTNATSKTSKVDNIGAITYIELLNPTEYRVVLPSTASLSVSVNQILPLKELHHTSQITGFNQTAAISNQTAAISNQTAAISNQTAAISNQTAAISNQTAAITSSPNQLTKIGISPAIAFVYNAWNPYLKQKTYLPIAPLLNETILSNIKCTVHAIWHSSKEEQSDLAELREYSIINNKNGGNAPMPLHLCGGAPIP